MCALKNSGTTKLNICCCDRKMMILKLHLTPKQEEVLNDVYLIRIKEVPGLFDSNKYK